MRSRCCHREALHVSAVKHSVHNAKDFICRAILSFCSCSPSAQRPSMQMQIGQYSRALQLQLCSQALWQSLSSKLPVLHGLAGAPRTQLRERSGALNAMLSSDRASAPS